MIVGDRRAELRRSRIDDLPRDPVLQPMMRPAFVRRPIVEPARVCPAEKMIEGFGRDVTVPRRRIRPRRHPPPIHRAEKIRRQDGLHGGDEVHAGHPTNRDSTRNFQRPGMMLFTSAGFDDT